MSSFAKWLRIKADLDRLVAYFMTDTNKTEIRGDVDEQRED